MTASFAASILVDVTVIAAAALAGTWLAGKSRAAVRHVILCAAFAALLTLPFATLIAPPVRITVRVSAPAAALTAAEPFARVFSAETSTTTESSSASVPQSSIVAASTAVVTIWIAGAALLLLPLLAALWHTRSLKRSALPWRRGQSIADALARDTGLRRSVTVELHDAVSGPLTCGLLRPAIVLPSDACAWTRDDARRAIVHELEHVRRWDWLTQLAARAVTACYWFHPLVWLAWRQFTLEAERACDDAVLRQTEPTAYADQLVLLAQRIVDRRSRSLVAMARRNDLPLRVAALLDSGQRRGPAGRAWVALGCISAAVLVASMSPLRIATAAQTSAADSRRFDVASVKPCKDEPVTPNGQRRPEYRADSPGRVSIECITLERMIYFAYAGIGSMDNRLRNDHPNDSSRIRGGPGWVRSDKFRVEARADGAPLRTVMMGPMLRALLEDRFQLKIHREAEEIPMYALRVAKGGMKMRPIDDGGCTAVEDVRDLTREARMAINRTKPICGNFTSLGDGVNRTWILGGQTLDDFANNTLSAVLDRHVMDETGVAGHFNIQLEFGLDESIRKGVFGGAGVGVPPDGIEKGPSIFTALEEQLGLRLERTRGPHDYIVIDRVQKPEPN